jgi:hypothetical protein
MTLSPSNTSIIRASFKGTAGYELSARLDLPAGPVRAFGVFAHCFTCTKDVLAAKRIASGLANAGVGVLRFDFTELGSSEGGVPIRTSRPMLKISSALPATCGRIIPPRLP